MSPIIARGTVVLLGVTLAVAAYGQRREDPFRPSPLCLAIVKRDVREATRLIERGADVNAGHGCALKAAAGRGMLEMVELLLDRGADPNLVVSGDVAEAVGTTPLASAVESRDIRVVRLLLERGSNPRDNFIAFKTVLNFGDVAMAELLLAHGANPNMTEPIGRQGYAWVGDQMVAVPRSDLAADRLDETAQRFQCRLSGGDSLLHWAVSAGMPGRWENGRDRIAKLLLDKGADRNLRNLNGSTPLMLVAETNDDGIRLLLDAGADVNVADRCGRTALMLAASISNLIGVTMLLDAGADVKAVDLWGRTAEDYTDSPDPEPNGLRGLSVADLLAKESPERAALIRAELQERRRKTKALLQSRPRQ